MNDKLSYTRDELVSMLKTNIIRVTFTKVDGNTRVMNCTLAENELPEQDLEAVDAEEPKAPKLNENIIAAWDVEKEDWRSFRVNSVTDIFVYPNQ